MRLDEAIKHAREVAENEKENISIIENHPYFIDKYDTKKYCIKRAEEHEQLAEWLEELKEYKENKHRSLRYMYEKGYNKAISEVDIILSADLPMSNVLHNLNEFILKNKGINYDDLDADKECEE